MIKKRSAWRHCRPVTVDKAVPPGQPEDRRSLSSPESALALVKGSALHALIGLGEGDIAVP